jgi:ABC-type branched-subunit amino acid transport system ATPase component
MAAAQHSAAQHGMTQRQLVQCSMLPSKSVARHGIARQFPRWPPKQSMECFSNVAVMPRTQSCNTCLCSM